MILDHLRLRPPIYSATFSFELQYHSRKVTRITITIAHPPSSLEVRGQLYPALLAGLNLPHHMPIHKTSGTRKLWLRIQNQPQFHLSQPRESLQKTCHKLLRKFQSQALFHCSPPEALPPCRIGIPSCVSGTGQLGTCAAMLAPHRRLFKLAHGRT